MGWQIGVNPLWSEPRWYALADAVASKLLTGKAPRVLRAVALRPHGLLDGLSPLMLRGDVPIDPVADDPFRLVIEERARLATRDDLTEEEREWRRLFLKVFANGTSYGIQAEMNRQEDRKSWVKVFTGDGSFPTRVRSPERAGASAFPPAPAVIAAGARLMLALLEHQVVDRGGRFAICDTDSMAIVARDRPAHDSAIPELSWDDVEDIHRAFDTLNPYDPAVISSILKVEDENFDQGERVQLWCYAISAKRYALFTR